MKFVVTEFECRPNHRDEVNRATRVYNFMAGPDSSPAWGAFEAEWKVWRRAANKAFRIAIAEHSETNGATRDLKLTYSSKGGCRCGCSPCFTASNSKGYSIFVTVMELDENGVPITYPLKPEVKAEPTVEACPAHDENDDPINGIPCICVCGCETKVELVKEYVQTRFS